MRGNVIAAACGKKERPDMRVTTVCSMPASATA
jgi:hypothetical protein